MSSASPSSTSVCSTTPSGVMTSGPSARNAKNSATSTSDLRAIRFDDDPALEFDAQRDPARGERRDAGDEPQPSGELAPFRRHQVASRLAWR